MTDIYTEFGKILFDIEDSFLRIEFFFLILLIISIFFFFTEGIIPKLILASFYSVFLLKFFSYLLIFNTNNFLIHTVKVSVDLDMIFIFNRLTYLKSMVGIFELSLLILAICNGVLLLKGFLNV